MKFFMIDLAITVVVAKEIASLSPRNSTSCVEVRAAVGLSADNITLWFRG
jgi:hypothetical protein